MPNGENISGLSNLISDIPLALLSGISNQGCTFNMLFEYDKVTHNSPFISNDNSVGPVKSPVGYSVILFELISKLPILFPIISANQMVLLSGESSRPIIPELFVGILMSVIFPFFKSKFPRAFIRASVNQILFLF